MNFGKSKPVEPAIVTVETTAEADAALLRIARLQQMAQSLQSQVEAEINAAKNRAAGDIQQYQQEIERLGKLLIDFAQAHSMELFTGKKSLELNYGTIGCRETKSIEVSDGTLAKLKKLGMSNAITVKESVNKQVLNTLDDKTLKKVEAVRVLETVFYYKVKENAVILAPNLPESA